MRDSMEIYQEAVARTMRRDAYHDAMAHFALGVAGEAGELVDPIKKHLFYKSLLNHESVAEELGDLLWYMTAIAETLGLSMLDIAMTNKAKLERRYQNGFTEAEAKSRADKK